MSRMLMMVLIVGAVCGRADAQPSPFDTDERTTAGWTFTPGASIGGLWDSGIQTASNPFVEAVFQKWVGLVSPRAELDFNSRRTHFNTGYSGSLEKYWASNLNWEQRGRVGVRQVVSRRLSASADASWAAAPTTDRLELVDGVIPYLEVKSTWLNATGGFQLRLGPRTNLDGAFRAERVTLDRPVEFAQFGALRDGHSYAPALGITRAFTERLSLGVRAEFRREYIGGTDEVFDARSGGGELAYQWSATTSISAGAGASQLESHSTGLTTLAPTFHAGFGHQVRRMKFEGRYQRAFQPLFGFGTLGRNDTFSGGASLPLADRQLFLKALVAYSSTRPVDALGIGFDFDTLWLNATVSRQLGRWVRGEAFVTVATQGALSSFFPGGHRHRIGVQFVTSKPVRIQ